MKKVLALVMALMLLMSSAALADITVSGWSMPATEAADIFWDSLDSYDFAIDYQPQPGYSDTVNMLTTVVASGDSSIDVMLIDEIMMLALHPRGLPRAPGRRDLRRRHRGLHPRVHGDLRQVRRQALRHSRVRRLPQLHREHGEAERGGHRRSHQRAGAGRRGHRP